MIHTAEGRDMLAHSVQYEPPDADRTVVAAKIAAIEAEARADLLARLRAEVEGLPEWHCSPCGESPHLGEGVNRAAVFDILDRAAQP